MIFSVIFFNVFWSELIIIARKNWGREFRYVFLAPKRKSISACAVQSYRKGFNESIWQYLQANSGNISCNEWNRKHRQTIAARERLSVINTSICLIIWSNARETAIYTCGPNMKPVPAHSKRFFDQNVRIGYIWLFNFSYKIKYKFLSRWMTYPKSRPSPKNVTKFHFQFFDDSYKFNLIERSLLTGRCWSAFYRLVTWG